MSLLADFCPIVSRPVRVRLVRLVRKIKGRGSCGPHPGFRNLSLFVCIRAGCCVPASV